MKKQIFRFIIIATLLFAFTACGKKEDTKDNDNTTDQAATTDQEASTDIEGTDDIDDSKTTDDQNETDADADTEDTLTEEEEALAKEMLGYMEGSTYINNFFGIEVTSPEEWYILSQEEQLNIMKMGLEAMGQSTETMNISDLNVLSLYSAYASDINVPTETFNANVSINAEKLTGLNAALTPESYLNVVISSLEAANLGFVFGDIEATSLGGKDLFALYTSVDTQGMTINQSYFCTKVDDYIVNIIISFTDEGQAAVTDILNSIKLSK